jgi:hypothetical protein
MNKIETYYEYPPISDRNYDWSAIWDNYDEGDYIGYGRTEHDAIADLLQYELDNEENLEHEIDN